GVGFALRNEILAVNFALVQEKNFFSRNELEAFNEKCKNIAAPAKKTTFRYSWKHKMTISDMRDDLLCGLGPYSLIALPVFIALLSRYIESSLPKTVLNEVAQKDNKLRLLVNALIEKSGD